jgi:hypothetical protein
MHVLRAGERLLIEQTHTKVNKGYLELDAK